MIKFDIVDLEETHLLETHAETTTQLFKGSLEIPFLKIFSHPIDKWHTRQQLEYS